MTKLERMLSLIPKKEDGKYIHGAKKIFCEKIGAPTNIISEWETGKTKSYRNYVHAVAMKYNVSVEWLKGETDQKENPATESSEVSDVKKRLIQKIMDGTDDQADFVLGLIDRIK